jgi:hypothetical protein
VETTEADEVAGETAENQEDDGASIS